MALYALQANMMNDKRILVRGVVPDENERCYKRQLTAGNHRFRDLALVAFSSGNSSSNTSSSRMNSTCFKSTSIWRNSKILSTIMGVRMSLAARGRPATKI
mmetsp:Transcript_33926/g.47426  ORF Transcript_33926/g.47426 Transcript_33926/m.47426 type:complete len:101 (-) Transcript_33926:237-539(-)